MMKIIPRFSSTVTVYMIKKPRNRGTWRSGYSEKAKRMNVETVLWFPSLHIWLLLEEVREFILSRGLGVMECRQKSQEEPQRCALMLSHLHVCAYSRPCPLPIWTCYLLLSSSTDWLISSPVNKTMQLAHESPHTSYIYEQIVQNCSEAYLYSKISKLYIITKYNLMSNICEE